MKALEKLRSAFRFPPISRTPISFAFHLVTGTQSDKGASIYDIRTEEGRGVSPKEDVVREVA